MDVSGARVFGQEVHQRKDGNSFCLIERMVFFCGVGDIFVLLIVLIFYCCATSIQDHVVREFLGRKYINARMSERMVLF